MGISADIRPDREICDTNVIGRFQDARQQAILTGLLGVAERVMELTGYLLTPAADANSAPDLEFSEVSEPEALGLYRDRDGDVWQRTGTGWRLCIQQGVAVHDTSRWNWADGHMSEYGPFVPIASS
ncbi:hypothetical protein ACFVUS_24790 [Nocardia sp. NPDC058058]|uniref:hypothetical protein n=1 Tax=Nocardia sp. NPDC058058 TaxID=3346317 RepID=UPI0036D7749E